MTTAKEHIVEYSMAVKEDAIISELKNGDFNRAATAFVRQYQSFVFNVAFRFMNSREDAEDISQEAFVKAIEYINSFRGESSVKTWLYKITKNLCLNSLRKQKIRKFFGFTNDDETINLLETTKDDSILPDDNFSQKEFYAALKSAIGKLPVKQRETFALRYFDDMSYKEISEILGTSVGGLKANYYQAVKKLSEELHEFKDIAL